ncbi:hypothetical protein TorRG33x02_113520 [Trema orientale]|uniref:Uncharacterized protein n=1 Tax=Trema orientale TaxID=63057 RepID=A0A2P5F4R3_TREOI|nr:hypothetical protein TorRG33x02_113520 [Trema orientale]
MQAEDQQSWRIEVRAKAKNFDFKLRAANIKPIHRLSVLLKLPRFFLTVNSESADSVSPSQTRGALLPRFLRIAAKIRSRWAKNRPIAAKKPSNCRKPEAKFARNRLQKYAKEEPISFGSLLVIIIGFVFQKGIVMFMSGFVFLTHIGLVMKKFEARKLWLLVVASALAGFLVVDLSRLSSYINFTEASSNFVWNPWKFAGSLI